MKRTKRRCLSCVLGALALIGILLCVGLVLQRRMSPLMRVGRRGQVTARYIEMLAGFARHGDARSKLLLRAAAVRAANGMILASDDVACANWQLERATQLCRLAYSTATSESEKLRAARGLTNAVGRTEGAEAKVAAYEEVLDDYAPAREDASMLAGYMYALRAAKRYQQVRPRFREFRSRASLMQSMHASTAVVAMAEAVLHLEGRGAAEEALRDIAEQWPGTPGAKTATKLLADEEDELWRGAP